MSSKLELLDGTTLTVTKLKGGAGMVTVQPPNSSGRQYHIFGEVERFINEIKNQVEVRMYDYKRGYY